MKTMTTKEAIEFFAENKDKFQYNEKGEITNITVKNIYGDTLKFPCSLDDILLDHTISMEIKEKKYKPYEQVDTWMLGLIVYAKEDRKVEKDRWKIQGIEIHNRIRLTNGRLFDLQQMFDMFKNEDGTPFGEEVV